MPRRRRRATACILDASLITGIDPPPEVESALAAINTAHNQVSSDISLAQAARGSADGAIQARRGDRNAASAQAEVEPIKSLAAELSRAAPPGPTCCGAYLRNVRLALFDKAQQIYMEAGEVRAITDAGLSDGGADGRSWSCSSREPVLLGLARIFGLYAIVQERTCRVYVLFGKVVGILDEPGLHFLPAKLGHRGVHRELLGSCHVLDLRLDQEYLRSQPVNSEEGAPMGIGIWYEMWISDPVAYLFKNTDPRGSLRANVSNATVRCLSNMPLAEMLQTRHNMSQTVRAEVTAKSQAWGYQLGSVYIRKVHFRDAGMIRQIEEKVVNRLRQVTSAIKQAGANQVSVITSSAEREAAIEFAKAAAMRPATLGQAFQEIAREPAVAEALFNAGDAATGDEQRGGSPPTSPPARRAVC